MANLYNFYKYKLKTKLHCFYKHDNFNVNLSFNKLGEKYFKHFTTGNITSKTSRLGITY